MREDLRQLCVGARDINSLHAAIAALAKSIGAEPELLPTYEKSIDGGHPHIECNHTSFSYVIVERGRESRRSVTNDPFELLYWTFHDVTFELALKKELKNRIEGQDFRRSFFQYHLELLNELDSSWKDKRQEQIDGILQRHPFDDASSSRADLCGQLRKQGIDDKMAWNLACQIYPLPLPQKS